MCTVTIVPIRSDDGAPRAARPSFRLACNRDESPLRPAALPPKVQIFRARAALMPIDPVSGGTWIAVNDAALTMTLMNTYPGDRSPAAPRNKASYRSRGEIIPALMHCADVGEAITAARNALHPEDYPPFRLLIVDRGRIAEIRAGGSSLDIHSSPRPDGPVMFTSSGLGDGVVEPPRRALFDRMVLASDDPAAVQNDYHAHVWPDRPEISVCMRRPQAQTVSYTLVEITAGDVKMTYQPAPPNCESETPPVVCTLSLRFALA